jgi:hypothetical protein
MCPQAGGQSLQAARGAFQSKTGWDAGRRDLARAEPAPSGVMPLPVFGWGARF